MIDRVALFVSDLERGRGFYAQGLEPLGYEVVLELEGFVAFGEEGQPRFAVRTGKDSSTTARVTNDSR